MLGGEEGSSDLLSLESGQRASHVCEDLRMLVTSRMKDAHVHICVDAQTGLGTGVLGSTSSNIGPCHNCYTSCRKTRDFSSVLSLRNCGQAAEPIFTNVAKYVSNTFFITEKYLYQIHFYYLKKLTARRRAKCSSSVRLR